MSGLMMQPRIRSGVSALVTVVLAVSGPAVTATIVRADDGPGSLPTPSPPVNVDAHDPDLKMVSGATLAPAKVLDIKAIIESEGGEERREDTNADVKFALQAEVLFGKDSAKLNSKANSRIEGIAEEIKKQSAKKVHVFGFTDDLGSSAHGNVLSKQRADAVQKVLAEDLGADVTFEIRGYGEQYPIADNSTEEGRKKNRRVEISFPRAGGDS